MIRSLFSIAAAVWFGYNALWFEAVGVYYNEGSESGLDGDPGSLAVTFAVRTLCLGLALVSLALVDWDWVRRVPEALTAPAREDDQSGTSR